MILLTHLGQEMAIFMLAIILGSILASKTQQSALVGQIILGIIIGPAVLGLVSYNEVVKALSELGIIFLIFLVGLECKFREVYTTKNLFVAISSAGITWVFGFGIAFIFGFTPLQGVFIATAIISTSTAVVAGLLRSTGKMTSSPA